MLRLVGSLMLLGAGSVFLNDGPSPNALNACISFLVKNRPIALRSLSLSALAKRFKNYSFRK